MNTYSKVGWGLSLCLVGGLLTGCMSGSSGTIEVTGKVTKGGQPVSGAAVTFVPTATDGKAASGTTDSSGAYKLTTFVNGDGALPGSYKVTVTKFEGSSVPATTSTEAGSEAKPADVDAIYQAMEKQGKYGPGTEKASDGPKNELAAKFASAETSGLTAEVKAGSTNFDFDVSE